MSYQARRATVFENNNPVLVRSPYLDREGTTYDVWLPRAGLSYSFNEHVKAYLSYGKNYIRPYAYMPILNLYNRLYSAFPSAGVPLKDLFRNRDIEKSDNVDIGLRLRKDLFELNPTIFLSRHENLLTVVTDPRVLDGGNPVNYQQNIGKAKGYGLELGTNIYLSDWLTFYLNPTYSRLTYDGNITYSGATLSTDGKQVVDVPEWTVSPGLYSNIKTLKSFQVCDT